MLRCGLHQTIRCNNFQIQRYVSWLLKYFEVNLLLFGQPFDLIAQISFVINLVSVLALHVPGVVHS